MKHRRSTTFVAYVINADNNRGDQLAGELRALRDSEPGLGIVGIIEATGNRLEPLPDMDHFVGRGPSRGNIAAYVADSLLGGKRLRPRWHDMRRTWPRTEGPGPHPPRSYATEELGRVLCVFAHVPPTAPGAEAARQEIVDSLVHLLAPWTRPGWRLLRLAKRKRQQARPRLLFIDGNGMNDEICRRTGMTAIGDGADALVYGGDVEVESDRYQRSFKPVGGIEVPFRGDHGRVLRVVLSIATKYLPKEHQ